LIILAFNLIVLLEVRQTIAKCFD